MRHKNVNNAKIVNIEGFWHHDSLVLISGKPQEISKMVGLNSGSSLS